MRVTVESSWQAPHAEVIEWLDAEDLERVVEVELLDEGLALITQILTEHQWLTTHQCARWGDVCACNSEPVRIRYRRTLRTPPPAAAIEQAARTARGS